MPSVGVVPKIQGMTSQIVDQRSLDFDGIMNFDMSRGVAKPRRGWEVLNSPQTYIEVADPTSPDGFSYTTVDETSFQYAARRFANPLGSFIYSADGGADYVLSLEQPFQAPLYVQALPVRYRIWDTQGRQIASGALPVSGMEREPADQAYTFARLFDELFFCNGGFLWQWNPSRSWIPQVVQCFHNPQQIGTDTYVIGELRGASIVTVHQQSLVLSGFAPDTSVSVDAPIDTNGDGIVTVLDFSRVGGFRLGPSATQLIVTQYTMMVSDPLLPGCFSIQGVYNIGTQLAVSGIASHYGRLVVMSGCECYVVDGPAAQASQATVQPLSTFIGCASHRSIAQTDNGLLVWLADDGIYSWDGSGLPRMITDGLQALFGDGWQALWQRLPVSSGNTANATNDLSRLFRFDRGVAFAASGVWLARDSYYALALTASSSAEYNNVVLCWSPERNLWWLYGGAPTDHGWDVQTDGINIWYTPNSTVTLRSCTAGLCTLMVSQNQPGILFGQGIVNSFPQSNVGGIAYKAPYDYVIAAMIGDCDYKIDYSGFGYPERQQFVATLQTAPFFLDDDAYKQNVWLHMKMRATRNNDTPCLLETNRYDSVGMLVLSENAHFDVLNQTDTSAEMQAFIPAGSPSNLVGSLSPFPDDYSRANALYFWQDNATNDPTKGAWYDAILGPEGVAYRRWLPDTFFNKRINLSRRASQWYRIVLWTRVTGCWDNGPSPSPVGNGGNSLEILGMSIEVEQYQGQR